jgi:CBS domain-containing membrane protein
MKKKIKRNMRMARYVIYKESLIDYKEHIWTFYKESLIDYKEHIWTFVGSFVGIGLIGLLNSRYLHANDNLFLIGSFGASSVLVYGIINSPFAQPRNLIGGHIISAIIGVSINLVIHEPWLAAALAVSTSIVLMQITKTLHPPGGATALIAIIGSERIKHLGYGYVFCPVLCGVLILFAVAMVFNNITSHRSYPLNKRWYRFWERRYR